MQRGAPPRKAAPHAVLQCSLAAEVEVRSAEIVEAAPEIRHGAHLDAEHIPSNSFS